MSFQERDNHYHLDIIYITWVHLSITFLLSKQPKTKMTIVLTDEKQLRQAHFSVMVTEPKIG